MAASGEPKAETANADDGPIVVWLRDGAPSPVAQGRTEDRELRRGRRRLRDRPFQRGHRTGHPAAHRRNRERSAAVRAWARGNGYDVSDRGQISTAVQQAFVAAH